MKIKFKFRYSTKSPCVYNASRVPCVGEYVTVGFDSQEYSVKHVTHILDAESMGPDVVAIVTVV
jgi:hypothetical protein